MKFYCFVVSTSAYLKESKYSSTNHPKYSHKTFLMLFKVKIVNLTTKWPFVNIDYDNKYLSDTFFLRRGLPFIRLSDGRI